MDARDGTRSWFPAKRYGWGWGPPRCWQGWAVVGVYVVATVIGVPLVAHHSLAYLFYAAGLSAALIAVCWWKGEPPRWRSGQ
jgi:hypothetical protein